MTGESLHPVKHLDPLVAVPDSVLALFPRNGAEHPLPGEGRVEREKVRLGADFGEQLVDEGVGWRVDLQRCAKEFCVMRLPGWRIGVCGR